MKDLGVVDVPAEDAAYASLYRVLPGEDPGNGGEAPETGTGSLWSSRSIASTAPTPRRHQHLRAVVPAVGGHVDQHGDRRVLLAVNDGWAYDSGTWVIEALPAGTYAISVHANGNWDILGPGPQVSADDESYVTIYSVDLREP